MDVEAEGCLSARARVVSPTQNGWVTLARSLSKLHLGLARPLCVLALQILRVLSSSRGSGVR